MYRTKLGLALLWVGLQGPPAEAGTFDERGDFSRTQPGTGFESTDDFASVSGLYQARAIIEVAGERLREGAALQTTAALEGDRVLALQGLGLLQAELDLTSLAPQAREARVDVRLWQRAEGQRVRPALLWRTASRENDPTPAFIAGALVLRPTGRVTTDGWREWSSGPVDFRLGGVLEPVLSLTPIDVTNEGFDFGGERAVWVDALEIDILSDAAHNATSCSTDCGSEGACRFGRCVDRVVTEGPDFARPEHRRQYTERRAFEWRTFLGHRQARTLETRTDAALSTLANGSDASFWPRLGRIIDETEDGHAQRPIVTGVSPLAPGICLQLGRADLLPNQPLRPLVYRTADGHPVSSRLEPGDALVAINEVDIESWLRSNAAHLPFSGDPRVRPVAETPAIAGLAARTGSRLRFERCERGDGCTSAQVLPIEVDYAELAEVLWSGAPPGWARRSLSCDHRLEQAGDLSDIAAPGHVDVRTTDGVPVLRFNATLGDSFGDYAAWKQEIDAAFSPPPSALILDQRRGDGGSFQGLHYLSRHLLARGETPISAVFPWLFGRETESGLRARLAQCARTQPSAFFGCGGAQWIPSQAVAPDVPNPGSGADARIAVLIALNVSGNDWLTDHLKRRRAASSGAVRVFGPAPTFGAFGEVVSLPKHRIGYFGPRLQWTGGMVAFGDLDPLDDFLDGNGVAPDVLVYQTQSDARAGVDTQLKVALQWLESTP